MRRRFARFRGLDGRSGITSLLDVVFTFPVIATVLFTMLYFGRAWAVRAAMEDVAAVGARWAATSLSGQQGCAQALEAMQQVLAGYDLDPAAASIGVRPHGNWGRNGQAQVSVAYQLDQGIIPLAGAWWGNPSIQRQLLVPIDRNVNRYENGWRTCGSERVSSPVAQPNEMWSAP